MRTTRGFTLVELLVVIAIVAVLMGILLPSLGRARHLAQSTACLSNIRQMEIAHYTYTMDHDGALIRANLAHGGVTHGDFAPWFETLRDYYGPELIARSPLDRSPHWGAPGDADLPIPGAPATQRRVTSYGINNFLDVSTVPWGPRYKIPYDGYTMTKIKHPSQTVHFLIMAYEGEFAGADHPHVESWLNHPSPPFKAQQHVQINAVGGDPGTWGGRTNWGFIDGHAEMLAFEDVFTDLERNRFDPSASP